MEQRMRIGYFADGPWGQKTFEKLLDDSSLEVVFLTVRYDKRDSVLMQMAEKAGVPILLEQNINTEAARARYQKFHADLFVSMSFNQIFHHLMLEIPPLHTINCHAGKLPFYRGRNILNWVLINDETEFGITVHYVDEGIDTGDIIKQQTYPITDEDTYATLLQRAYAECPCLLYMAIKEIQSGMVKRVPQAMIDPIGMYCGMRGIGDEILDWHQSSRDVFNFVRAICRPGPEARSFIHGKEIKINRVQLIKGVRPYKNIPGQVVGYSKNGFFVKTLDTVIEVVEYFYDGKIHIGDRLKSSQENVE